MSKDVIVLGMKDEVLALDLGYMDEEAIECMMEWVHEIVYQELVSRQMSELAVWSLRTENVFKKNGLICLSDVINIPKAKVSIIDGCGHITRKEIYDTCKEYGVILLNWEPGVNYKRENSNNHVFEEVKKSEM